MNPVNRLLEKVRLRVVRLSFAPARKTSPPTKIGKYDPLVPPQNPLYEFREGRACPIMLECHGPRSVSGS